MRSFKLLLLLLLLPLCSAHSQQGTAAAIPNGPVPQAGRITGTAVDTTGGFIPHATATLQDDKTGDRKSVTAGDDGSFEIDSAAAGTALHVIIHADGFADWTSSAINLAPGQSLALSGIGLTPATETTVDAVQPEVAAAEEVHEEEQQRILGFVPNFYVTYEKNPVPLTTKLKYQLAFRTATDAVTFGGAVFLATINQAADTPDYHQGWGPYGQRVGAAYAGAAADVMIGGAILPSLLHQDPRYFFQGTGTNKSRALHAISAPFVARGDNGKMQFNYSSVGGDLATGALENLYYPASNRGPGLVFTGALVTTAGRVANALAQEFLLPRFTSHAKH